MPKPPEVMTLQNRGNNVLVAGGKIQHSSTGMKPFRYDDLPQEIKLMILKNYFQSDGGTTQLMRDGDYVKSTWGNVRCGADTTRRHKLYKLQIYAPNMDFTLCVIEVRLRPTSKQLFVSKSFLRDALEIFARSTTIEIQQVKVLDLVEYTPSQSIVTSSAVRVLSHVECARVKCEASLKNIPTPLWSSRARAIFQLLPKLREIEVYDNEPFGWHGSELNTNGPWPAQHDRKELTRKDITENHKKGTLPKGFPPHLLSNLSQNLYGNRGEGAPIIPWQAKMLLEETERPIKIYSLLSVKCRTKSKSILGLQHWLDAYVVST